MNKYLEKIAAFDGVKQFGRVVAGHGPKKQLAETMRELGHLHYGSGDVDTAENYIHLADKYLKEHAAETRNARLKLGAGVGGAGAAGVVAHHYTHEKQANALKRFLSRAGQNVEGISNGSLLAKLQPGKGSFAATEQATKRVNQGIMNAQASGNGWTNRPPKYQFGAVQGRNTAADAAKRQEFNMGQRSMITGKTQPVPLSSGAQARLDQMRTSKTGLNSVLQQHVTNKLSQPAENTGGVLQRALDFAKKKPAVVGGGLAAGVGGAALLSSGGGNGGQYQSAQYQQYPQY